MDNNLYDYSPIAERPSIIWPENKKVAFYIGLNLEHYKIGTPSTSIFPGTAALDPDPLNFGWRDYGLRVGFWRMLDSLDKYAIRASAIINSDVCDHYPQVIKAGVERGWNWIAHGRDNSTLQAHIEAEEEKEYLRDIVSVIEKSTGQTPKGWLGPALTESHKTPSLLAELGLEYLLDWCADDQPFALNIPDMISVPYSIELNDVTLFSNRNLSGDDFLQIFKDYYRQLSLDAQNGSGRVMALAVHPFIVNQPFRHKYLDQALEFIVEQPDVWVTTSDEISDYFKTRVI